MGEAAGVREDAAQEVAILPIQTVDAERVTRRAMMSDRRKPSIRVDKGGSIAVGVEAAQTATAVPMREAVISALRKFSGFL